MLYEHSLSHQQVLAFLVALGQIVFMPWGMVLVFGVVGCLVGCASSVLLRRIRQPAPISMTLCAMFTGLLWMLVGWQWLVGDWRQWWAPMPLLLATIAVPLVLTDLRHRRLPDVFTLSAYPLFAIALMALAYQNSDVHVLWRAGLAALVLIGIHSFIGGVFAGAMGSGDIKLVGALGLVLGAVGWSAVILAIVLAAVVTVGLGLVGRVVRPAWRDGIPHGPGLLGASCLIAAFPGAMT